VPPECKVIVHRGGDREVIAELFVNLRVVMMSPCMCSVDHHTAQMIPQRKHRLIGHVSRHDGLMHEIIKGRMRGKPTSGMIRIQMLQCCSNVVYIVSVCRRSCLVTKALCYSAQPACVLRCQTL